MTGRFVAPAIAVFNGLGAIVCALPAAAQDGQPIGSIEVKGNVKTNRTIILNALAAAGIKTGAIYRREMVNDARQRVLAEGYYSDIYIRADLTADKKASITAEVVENPVIQYIRIKGNTKIPADRIKERLSSREGTVINTNTIREDAQLIQRIYRQAGYEAFLSEIEDVFDPRSGTLTFPVTETVVESIEIEGLKKTKGYVVTREMRTKVGDALNINTLKRDLTRIFGTGLFQDVGTPRTEPAEEGKVKLIVPVQEQRTGQIQVGFGYSVAQRLTGTVEVAEQNFQGKGQTVNAAWTVGGTVARNQFELGFSEPWLDRYNTSIGINLYSRFNFRFNRVLSSNATNGQNSNPYFEERRGGSVTLSRPTSEFSRAFTTLRTEGIRANNLQPDYSQLTNDEINNIRGALVQNGDVSSVTLRYLTNTRDNEQDPAAGFYLSPSVEVGSAAFSSQKPRLNPAFISTTETPDVPRVLVDERNQRGGFTKFVVDSRRYFNLSRTPRVTLREPKTVLAVRTLLGTSGGNLAFAEQFFMGGADNLRGFADDRFWGNNLFLTSVELRIPLDRRSGSLTLVTFLDVGDAWGASSLNRENIPGFGQHSGFGPRIGAGFGVRLRTPVGPVRLDLGRGETTRTHFSIGQAF
ncbi:MAG: BamA/TamA family outer membrane protein [Capsulimonadales bacterium]|nr:BamA/TamA family outer membrane protein [Capsulimonadales bacterium]